MAYARFAYENRVLRSATTITASSEAADRPATYLKSASRWKKWRSATATTNQTVTVNFNASTLVRVIALVDWRAHTGGSILAETWTGSAWTSFGTFTLPSTNPTGVIALWNTTGVTTTQIRITFTNTTSANESVEVGVVVAGTYFQPEHTLSDGFEITPVDPSVIVAALDGQEEAQTRTAYHTARGTFEVLDDTALAGFRALFASAGHRSPFLFAIDPADPGEMLYARLVESPYLHQYQDRWTFPVTVREVR
jgi:hypothetical protein